MNTMMKIGALITIIGGVLMPMFGVLQNHIPRWPQSIFFYGLSLIVIAKLFMVLKNRKLMIDRSTESNSAESLTIGESVSFLFVAIIPVAIFDSPC